jgi:hypothetical protein
MPKRFTDSNEYRKPFVRSLKGPYKLLWNYLYHECDHAGIWTVDFEMAQFLLGTDMPVNKEDALKCFNNDEERIITLEAGKKWFIKPFIEFQYGELNPQNRVHHSIIQQLRKYKINLSLSEENKPLVRGFEGAKEKDKEIDKEKDNTGVQGENELLTTEIKTKILQIFHKKRFQDPLQEYEKFISHYSKTGWLDANSNKIKDPLSAAQFWDQKPSIGKKPDPVKVLTPNEAWQRLVTDFIEEVQTEEATTMVLDLKVIELKDKLLLVQVKSKESIDLLENKYFTQFSSCFKKHFPEGYNLNYKLTPNT